jgi:hypothetical protein
LLKVEVMSVPVDAPVWRLLQCPVCGSVLSVTTSPDGVHLLPCKDRYCRQWRVVARQSEGMTATQILEHVTSDRLRRLIIDACAEVSAA